MSNIQNFLIELSKLEVPMSEYVIVSSGPMAIVGLRECSDLDVLVSKKLFDELSQTHEVMHIPEFNFSRVSIGNIDFLYKNPEEGDKYPFEKQRDEADIIEGYPFQNLQTCLYFKENSTREKDKNDIVLIKEYLAKK